VGAVAELAASGEDFDFGRPLGIDDPGFFGQDARLVVA
jgi:hypothetical protein